MLISNFESANTLFDEENPTPRLFAATDRLRRFAAINPEQLGEAGQQLLEDALAAAAEAEQSLAIQRARMRYLEGLSVTDELTGILNRRGFLKELDRAMSRSLRTGERGLLILADMNHFKQVNDTHGHPAGDEALRCFAAALTARTRQSDYIGRLGGDEFGAIFTHTTLKRARRRWCQIEQSLNSTQVAFRGSNFRVTASFGSAAYGPGVASENLLFLADKDLYSNKALKLVASDTQTNGGLN